MLSETSAPSSPVDRLFHPDLVRIVECPGEFNSYLVAQKDYKIGEIICSLEGATRGPKAYSSVQYGPGPDEHIELNSDLLYVNHSCEPNVQFNLSSSDMNKWSFEAADNIKEGTVLCFFYPSTEWIMATPFECNCKTQTCLGTIRGASVLSREELQKRGFVNPHIWDLVKQREQNELVPSSLQMASKQPSGEQVILSTKPGLDTVVSRLLRYAAIVGVAALCLFVSFYFDVQISIQHRRPSEVQSKTTTLDTRCKPYLPSQLTLLQKLLPSRPDLELRGRALDKIVRKRVAKDDIDSVVIGIVGPDGLLWSQGYGVARANKTDATDPPNRHSIYRIASVSKLYATLETFILRERGALTWDDPITQFFPNFTYKPYGWREHRAREEFSATNGEARNLDPITLRQLASHMSGIGRDYPPYNLKHWPHVPPSASKRSTLFTPEGTYPQKPEIFQAIADYPLVAPQYSYPIYSNTGFSLLGWCISVADEMSTGKAITYAEIIKRDIFKPLGMNGSSFLVSSEQAPHMAFPRIGIEADYDMTDAHNSAGGQLSSVFDLAQTTRALLNPGRHGILSPYSLREWFRPLHVFPDRLTRVGLAWEIQEFFDSHGRAQSYYSKSGNLRYYHSEISINPELGFGLVVLMAGRYSDSSWFSKRAINIFQPFFEHKLEETTRSHYSGEWVGSGDSGENAITLVVTNGSLWVTKCVVNGDDLLEIYAGGNGLTLWSTGRLHEFRVAIGRAELNSDYTMGCLPYWVTFDAFNSHSAPIDLVYFSEQEHGLQLNFPSVNVTLHRKS